MHWSVLAHIPQKLFIINTHGQWTVSVKGGVYHNLMLDEAHECIINRNLKSIATRPSHFLMVQLANFMSYLDKVVNGVEESAYKWHKSEEYEKRSDTHRTEMIFQLLKSVDLYSNTVRSLSNVLIDKTPVLDTSNIKNLLSISVVGHEHMMSYIRQNSF